MTFMHQNLDLTLLDSSLNMELYHKDHLYLIKNGNIKFFKINYWNIERHYHHNNHYSYHHHACNNRLWSYRYLHLHYPGQILLQLKQFPNHLHLNHCQPQQDPSTLDVKVFCLILRLLHQNFKHPHHHFFAKCFPHRSRQLLTIHYLLNQVSS